MRKIISVVLACVLFVTLCACGKAPVEEKERACGLYINMETADVYTVSYGTDTDSGSVTGADGGPLHYGSTVHFDFAGEAAEKNEPAVIEYTVYIYDKDMNVISSASFSHDFSSMARVELTVTSGLQIVDPNDTQFFGGDVVVELATAKPESKVSVAVPTVIMNGRPEAAEKINEAIGVLNDSFTGKQLQSSKKAYDLNVDEASKDEEIKSFSMNRYVRVLRGDSSVLSLRFYDKISLGTRNEIAITGHNFSSQTGEELSLTAIASDFAKLRSLCSEKLLSATTSEDRFSDVIFNDGYTDALQGLISDGHWYLSDKGLVIAADPGSIAPSSFGSFEFTVSYDDLVDIILPAYLPSAPAGTGGELRFSRFDGEAESLALIGSAPGEGSDAVLVSVSGSIYNVCVYNASVNDKGKYSLDTQLWYCSDLCDGASFIIPKMPSSEPNIYVGFLRGDGVYERMLLSRGSDGEIRVKDPDGMDNGLDISASLPYQVDLNSDGIGETVGKEKSENGCVMLTVSSSEKSYELVTDIVKSFKLRVHDLDGDGVRELYYDGKNADGTYVCGCAVFDHSSLDSVKFDGNNTLSAKILGFEDGKLIVKGDAQQSYVYADGKFTLG